ncbi:piezo-type mechanosensitive ion channel component 1-like [Tachypleus tridentatus]|uniref:piezo-type mechanosensitive ion channel component 1-like n=1 Tax=Tachypleus tridentatus TaxID=6853 RepID=UPI003FD13CB6
MRRHPPMGTDVISCVFLSSLYKNLCWLVQLLGIVCIKKLSIDSKSDTNNVVRNDGCTAPVDEAGLLWDGICFVFLLLQKRIFCSYYFQHLVVETEVQKLLASRGAILINENKIKEVHKQHAAQSEIMEKIKKKMDKILSRQINRRQEDNTRNQKVIFKVHHNKIAFMNNELEL